MVVIVEVRDDGEEHGDLALVEGQVVACAAHLAWDDDLEARVIEDGLDEVAQAFAAEATRDGEALVADAADHVPVDHEDVVVERADGVGDVVASAVEPALLGIEADEHDGSAVALIAREGLAELLAEHEQAGAA